MITGKRIRNPHHHLSGYVTVGDSYQLGKQITSMTDAALKRIGFTNSAKIGDAVLPADNIGKVARINAHGHYGPPKRNLPKIPYNVSFASEIKDWHGDYHSVIINQVRERYQRDFFPPLAIELSIMNDVSGAVHLVTGKIVRGANEAYEAHAINLILEMFNECEIYSASGARIINAPVNRVNWRMLPPGELQWDKLRAHLSATLSNVKTQHKEIVETRIKHINSFSPKEVHVGLGGFSEYLAFRFKSSNTWILECVRSGNATYVMNHNWKQISQLTKSEVIQGNLAKDRIIHNPSWLSAIENVIASDN